MSKLTANRKVPWKVPVQKRIVLIDADGLLYSAALNGVTTCEGEQMQMLDDSAILADLADRVAEIEEWCGETKEVFLCLSARKCFRKDIFPAYKAQRKEGARPITLDALRGAVMDGGLPGYPTMLIANLEADDVCGIAATTFQAEGYETVIVSPDKDLLQIPGMVITPGRGGPVFSDISKARGDRWHLYQMLVGDTCDNYPGCRGMGPVKAEKLLDYCEDQGFGPSRTWGEVVDQFLFRGQTEEDALLMARVSRILRKEDWDAKKKEPKLWTPPCA